MFIFSPQLLDIGIATQTPAAQKAMMELLNFEEASNLQYPLRYLLGAAYSTHPGPYLIKDLLVKSVFICFSKKRARLKNLLGSLGDSAWAYNT